MITALFQLFNAVIGLFIWALILAAVFSMLTAFGVLDTRNRLVWSIGDFLFRVTEPVLRPVRNVMPNLRQHRPQPGGRDPAAAIHRSPAA